MVSFAGAIFVGLVAGNTAHVILGRALVVMILSWMAGRLIGGLAQHYVQQTIEQYKLAHPVLADEVEASSDVGDQDEEKALIEAVPERFGREFAGGLPGSTSGQTVSEQSVSGQTVSN